jgi:hypothetical protein
VLDYLAHDIREKRCSAAKPGARFYFPILPNSNQFATKVAEWFPGLQTSSPALWSYLESIQPYQSDYEWLGNFNRVNNDNKHVDLVEQTRIEVEQVHAGFQGGSVTWNPAKVRYGSSVVIHGVPVDPRTQMPVPSPSLKVERITWVDFHFAGVGVSALGLLKAAVPGISTIIAAAEKLI